MELRGLSSVRVSKEFLLNKLEENMVLHEKSYNDIIDARQLKVIEVFSEVIEKVKLDKMYGLPGSIWQMSIPEKHVKDYERAIGMIGASLDKEFLLTRSEYDQYINDDWSWKSTFLTVSGTYFGE